MEYNGVLWEKGFNEPAYNITVSAITDKDTLVTKTNGLGQFHFQNISSKIFRLSFGGRGYRHFDTLITFHQQKSKDTFQIEAILRTKEGNIFYNRASALNDIKRNNIFVLLPGGFAGSEIFDEDTTFELKYRIEYSSLGCTRSNADNEIEYNRAIFEYLDRTYGKAWRGEIRKDAIGLK